MDSFGSNGVLTLANVESAENGCASAPAGDLINSNTDADIAADFVQLSGGASTMTLTQLTSAVKLYADPQSQRLNGYCNSSALPGLLVRNIALIQRDYHNRRGSCSSAWHESPNFQNASLHSGKQHRSRFVGSVAAGAQAASRQNPRNVSLPRDHAGSCLSSRGAFEVASEWPGYFLSKWPFSDQDWRSYNRASTSCRHIGAGWMGPGGLL
jgi:hypothetical protein